MTAAQRPLGLRFWLIAAAAVAGMWVTASLGRWQLSRAAEKEALQSILDTRGQLAPLDGSALVSPGAGVSGGATATVTGDETQALIHRTVVLKGRWLPAHTVFLDNRQMHGRPGFFVLTPLQLQEPNMGVVLVQRGWVPRNFEDRTRVPSVSTPEGVVVRVQGRVAAAPSRLFEFQAGDRTTGSSRIRQNLDLAAFRTETGLALTPLTVLQTGDASEGLQRDWLVVGSGVDKHYGYAFQWFGLCGLIAILYVWFQIVRRFIRPRSQPAA